MAISFQEFVTIAEASLDRTDLAGMTVRYQERDRSVPDRELKRTKVVVGPDGKRTKEKVRPKPPTAKTTEDGRNTTAQIGPVNRNLDPKERAARAAAVEKERRRKAALARRGGGDSKPAAPKPNERKLEKQATELLRQDVQSKKPESGPKRIYTKQKTSDDDMRTTDEKRADAKKARRRRVAEKKKEILDDYIADYTKKNGSAPKGPERTRLVARATAAAEAMTGTKSS